MTPERAAEWQKGDFRVSTRFDQLDLDVIHGFLHESYWAGGIPRATVEKSIRNSLCFGLLHRKRQIGFARVVSDYTTFAYLADVFVLPQYRGQGLAKWLMQCIMEHSELAGLRRWLLVTRDAHGLYEKLGFKPLAHPEKLMEIHVPDIYRQNT
ncbi:MAG TPA: GNAT family N-acetyltransferase [Candidatus Acidoferrales bacterium]|nr:GNAT family N-acetyltransferase [Candidatus Acidoferrales bacterium]